MVDKMEDGFKLEDSKIAIIGLGLMGGSLALALNGKCAALYGIDSNPATLELALDNKIVDSADVDPAKILAKADLIIFATPVSIIIRLIQQLPSFTSHPCIVFDLGSTKLLCPHGLTFLVDIPSAGRKNSASDMRTDFYMKTLLL
jgi:predicted dinucleotide-binding enzyme